MAINTQKFLPSSKGGALTKVAKISKGSVAIISEKSQKNIGIIKVKVIEIDKLLKGTIASQKKELNAKRIKSEEEKFSELESKLETKPKAEKGKIEMPKVPKMGFLDWIKNFIGNIILGYFAVRLVDQLPKLKGVISFIGKASDFVLDIGGKLLDGLVTFIDWGYKAYDATRGFVKNLFGQNEVKQFDRLSSLLNQFLNLAIIAGMVAAGSGGGRGGRGGGARLRPGMGGRPRVTTSGGGRAGGIDIRNPLRERPTITEGRGGRTGFRLPELFGGKPKAKVTVGGSAEKGLFGGIFKGLKGPKAAKALGFVGRGLEVAALIPTVLEVIDLVKQKKYKDAVRTIISAGLSIAVFETVMGATGAAALAEEIFSGGVATPAAIATLFGGVVASTAASAGTSAVSDALLKKLGLEDKPKGMRSGGTTSKGPKRRTLNTKKGKYKRKLAPRKPGQVQIQPGADVGGEDKLFGLFPNPLKAAQNAIDMMNPFKVIENTGKELGKSDYFGPILAITSKILLGQKPNQKDYENVGLGINLLVSKGLNEGQLKGGLAAAFAEGGFVDPKTLDAINQGGDITNWVAKAFRESTENNTQDILRDIQENLRLKKGEPPAPTPDTEGTGGVGGEYSPSGLQGDIYKYLLSKGMDDIHALGIMANISRESGFRPGADETGTGSGGVGLFQYTYPARKEKFLKAVADYKTNWKGQIDYAINESVGPQYLKMNFKSPQEAADWWMLKWENPAEDIKYDKGPKIHAQYLASLEKFKTQKGYQIPTSADVGSMLGGSGKLKQYLTGDHTDKAHYDKNHDSIAGVIDNYHDHLAFADHATAVNAYNFFKQKGFTVTELLGNPYSSTELARRHSGPDHPAGLAFDVPGIQWGGKPGTSSGPREWQGSAKVRDTLKQFLGGSSNPAIAKAYAKGGETLAGPHLAMLGEKGREIVVDADSSGPARDMLLAINQAKDHKGVMKAIQQYAPYDALSPQTIVMPSSGGESDYDSGMSGGGVMMMDGGGGDSYDPFDALEMGG